MIDPPLPLIDGADATIRVRLFISGNPSIFVDFATGEGGTDIADIKSTTNVPINVIGVHTINVVVTASNPSNVPGFVGVRNITATLGT